jgi:hypothetical protein
VLEALWPERQRIIGSTALYGVHVPSRSTVGIQQVRFNIDGLSAWLESAPDDKLPAEPASFGRRYPGLTGVSGPHGSKLRLTVQANTTYQHKAAVVGQLRTLTPYVWATFETPVSIVQLIDLLDQVVGLVTVATLVPCAPHRVEGSWVSEGPWGREESAFSLVTPTTLAPEPDLRPPAERYLLPAEHVQALLTSWLGPEKTEENLRRAANLATDVFGALRLSPFIRVNAAVSAAEALHASMKVGVERPQDEYDAVKQRAEEALRQTLSESEWRWFGPKFHPNQPGTGAKIRAVADDIDPQLAAMLWGETVEKWPGEAARRRHTAAHGVASDADEAERAEVLARLTAAAVLCSTAKRLGWSPDIELIQSIRGFRRLRQYARGLYPNDPSA